MQKKFFFDGFPGVLKGSPLAAEESSDAESELMQVTLLQRPV